MKLSEILTKKTYDQYGDMDVTNDCIDELAPAWCGNLLTDDEEEAPPKSDKEVFIKTYVEPMLIAANVGIKAVDYYLHETPYIDENYRTHYHEEVVLTYESGFTRLINVECDSKAAMVEDIYKQGGVY